MLSNKVASPGSSLGVVNTAWCAIGGHIGIVTRTRLERCDGVCILRERAAGDFTFPLSRRSPWTGSAGCTQFRFPARLIYECNRFAPAGLLFFLLFSMGRGRGRTWLWGVDLTFLLAGAGADGISVGGVAGRCRAPGRWCDALIWVGDWRRRDGLQTDVGCQFLDGGSAEQIQPAHFFDQHGVMRAWAVERAKRQVDSLEDEEVFERPHA